LQVGYWAKIDGCLKKGEKMKLTKLQAQQLVLSAAIVCFLAIYYFFFSRPDSFAKGWLEVCCISAAIIVCIVVFIKVFFFVWDWIPDMCNRTLSILKR
jgi:uncharacterized membrane protein (DUF485 family)